MPLYLGSNSNPSKLYVGTDEVQKVYLGANQVWPSVSGTGTFKVYVNQTPSTGGTAPADPTLHQGMQIADGGLVEGVAPLPLMVVVDDFAGFITNDPRELTIAVDYGERYEAQYHTPANFPSELRMLQGSTLGYYPGFVSGHNLRGTDMAGGADLSPSNTTVDRTITVRVSDGTQTSTLTFTARLIHPDVYYTDRTKATYAPNAVETSREGIVFFSRDGDFTGALPEQAQTATQAGVYHHHIPDGVFNEFFWQGDFSGLGGPNFPFNGNAIACIDVRFKGGETYYASKELVPWGQNSRLSSWGTGQAIIDGEEMRSWTEASSMVKINGYGTEGLRLDNLHFRGSDYDPRSDERREWWNILNYTNKSGAFVENSGVRSTEINGDIITNGTGVYAQIIGDTGTALITRQVVDTADPNDITAQPAAFADGDTLTGGTSGATVTFVAAGSRQDRTVRAPADGVSILDMKKVAIDSCVLSGCYSGIGSVGTGSVVSDNWVDSWFNYGTYAGNNTFRWSAWSGNALTQPVGFVSETRDFGASVSPSRADWNVVRLDDTTQPMDNAIAHNAHRSAVALMCSYHFNKVHCYGGHGSLHQPVFRMATGGQASEDRFYCVFWGNGISGGALPITFGVAVGGAYPYTARGILVEANHLLGQDTSVGALMAVQYTGTTARNNLIEYPTGIDFGETGCNFIGMDETTYSVNPDVNPKDITLEFNTFVFESNNGLVADEVGTEGDNLRNNPVTWSNNAYAIDTTKVGSLSTDITAINDNPSHFNSDWRPQATAHAYQSATGTIPPEDATGTDRPANNASRGAFEPG